MKYFLSQSKIQYPTTIGSFNIVDMTTYYQVDDSQFKTKEIDVDNTETLIELGQSIYGDVDSFWLFLLANKSINPFNLLDFSNTSVKETANNLVGLHVQQQSIPDYVDAILTPGSILLPETRVGGSAWNYGSTGNFSLTGGFSVVEQYNNFSKRMITKQPVGFTFALNGYLSALVKGETGYSLYNFTRTIDGTTYTGQIFPSQIVEVTSIVTELDYSLSDKDIYAKVTSEYPVIKKGSGTPAYEFIEEAGGATLSIDINTTIETNINKINSYISGTMKYSAFTRIVQNYEV